MFFSFSKRMYWKQILNKISFRHSLIFMSNVPPIAYSYYLLLVFLQCFFLSLLCIAGQSRTPPCVHILYYVSVCFLSWTKMGFIYYCIFFGHAVCWLKLMLVILSLLMKYMKMRVAILEGNGKHLSRVSQMWWELNFSLDK